MILRVDPYQKKNLSKDNAYDKEKNVLPKALENWMTEQNDFLLRHKMPLIIPTQNPLDKQTLSNKIPEALDPKLKNEDYLRLHY